MRSQHTKAWLEGNRRLYLYYQALVPALPDNFRDMEPLFLAVICGCQAGRLHNALHEVYLPRIQRGDAAFAANFLGARGTLLSVLAHFFVRGRWGAPMQTNLEAQELKPGDQLIILMQAGLYSTATRGLAAPEVRTCYECAEALCHLLNRPLLLYVALMGQWRYSCVTDKLTATMQIAERVYLVAQKQADTVLMIGACHALAGSLYFLGDFEAARNSARRGVQLWRSRGLWSPAEEVIAPAVGAEETEIETALHEAICIARQQKSIPLMLRAEASSAAYRGRKGRTDPKSRKRGLTAHAARALRVN